MRQIGCESCGKHYRWKPALAGKRAKCTCGAEVICPVDDPGDFGAYAVAGDTEPKIAKASAAPAATPVRTLAYRSAAVEPRGSTEPEAMKGALAALWMLGGGIVIQVGESLFQSGSSIFITLMRLGLGLGVGTALMLAGILIASRLRHIPLGPFWITLVKLAAICVAPDAVIMLASPVLFFIPLGGLVGLGVEFVLYFALMGALFDLDESDTWYCVWTIFLVRLAVYFSMMWWGGR